MTGIVESLGEPQMSIAGLRLWVHGRMFSEASSKYDLDLLRGIVACDAPGASVVMGNPSLGSWNFAQFLGECERLRDTLAGRARLGSDEPEFGADLTSVDRFGHLNLEVEITPQYLEQEHTFRFRGLDQSYLPPVIEACERILAEYPTTLEVPQRDTYRTLQQTGATKSYCEDESRIARR